MSETISPQPSCRNTSISIRTDIQVLQGCLYGSAQPLISLTLDVDGRTFPDLAVLDRAIRSLADNLAFAAGSGGVEGIAARVGELAKAVQAHFGHPICAFQDTRLLSETAGGSTFRMRLPYHDPQAAAQVVGWAVRAMNTLIDDPQDPPRARMLAKELAVLGSALRSRAAQDLNTGNLIHSAWKMGVPVARVVGNIFRFGHGVRSRLLDSSFTDRTPIIAAKIAADKPAAAHVMRDAGLPVPDHIVVASAEAALKAAHQLGFPLVVKPTGEEGGRGVFAGLRDERSFSAAAAEAFKLSKHILVERHFHGNDFRLTVLDSRVIKVEQRIAAGVMGDGISTVAQLVAAAQASPRMQNILHNRGKMVVSLDDEALGLLAEQGLGPSSIPVAGRRATLRRKNNVSAGGEQIGISVDRVHPDNLALAVRAAELLDLDFAGIDLLIPDIFASWLETGAAICEINGRPQVGVRTSPEIYTEIVRTLLQNRGRIPLHLMVTKDGETLPARTLDALAGTLSCNAIATGHGAWIDGRRIVAGPLRAFANCRNLLSHTGVRGAICVMAVAEIAAMGLPSAHFDTIIDLAGDDFDGIREAIAPHADRIVKGFDDA